MKRSVSITLVTITALTVVACGDPPRKYTNDPPWQKAINCQKPEDFSVSECHDPKNHLASPTNVPGQTYHHSSGGFFFYPWIMSNGGVTPRSYGPSTPSATTYGAARAVSTYSTAPSAVARGGFGSSFSSSVG